jgi:hypothetical protein
MPQAPGLLHIARAQGDGVAFGVQGQGQGLGDHAGAKNCDLHVWFL